MATKAPGDFIVETPHISALADRIEQYFRGNPTPACIKTGASHTTVAKSIAALLPAAINDQSDELLAELLPLSLSPQVPTMPPEIRYELMSGHLWYELTIERRLGVIEQQHCDQSWSLWARAYGPFADPSIANPPPGEIDEDSDL